MAEMEMKGRKKRLPINLSFLTLADSKKKQAIARKSLRNFHDPIAGVGVGLGILAALNNQDLTYNRNAVLVMSPKSATSPISIYRNMNSPQDKKLCVDKMAFCEEYTCVISHVGKNIIKKREYFEADILVNDDEQPAVLTGDAAAAADPPVGTANFLSSCFLCKKMLHGLDVFIYRGDKAFCSEECRCRQISIDEQKEKCRTGLAMPMGEYPASSCSVAAA